jgi:hypothetical protein
MIDSKKTGLTARREEEPEGVTLQQTALLSHETIKTPHEGRRTETNEQQEGHPTSAYTERTTRHTERPPRSPHPNAIATMGANSEGGFLGVPPSLGGKGKRRARGKYTGENGKPETHTCQHGRIEVSRRGAGSRIPPALVREQGGGGATMSTWQPTTSTQKRNKKGVGFVAQPRNSVLRLNGVVSLPTPQAEAETLIASIEKLKKTAPAEWQPMIEAYLRFVDLYLQVGEQFYHFLSAEEEERIRTLAALCSLRGDDNTARVMLDPLDGVGIIRPLL